MNKTYSLITDYCSCNSPEFRALLNKYEELEAAVDLYFSSPDVYQELLNSALRELKNEKLKFISELSSKASH
ncbi:MAG: hypothetical protein DRQ13_07690 [Ignavibacteriae bacterium]|nr:MAG: hypothetical protein DRQ13_07690 [Ignavibacteriota bacterium]